MGIGSIGGGISIFNGGMPANPNNFMINNPQVKLVTLDSSGQASVAIANANTHYGVATIQDSTGFQSGIGRVTPTDQNNLIFQADVQGAAQDKLAAIIYW